MNAVNRKSLWMVLLAIPLALIIGGFDFGAESLPWEVQTLLTGCIYGEITISGLISYLPVMKSLAFMLVFNVLYANELSSHFRHSCVFVFSRLKTRRQWYLRQVGKLALYCLGFIYLYVGVILGRCTARSSLPVTGDLAATVALITVFSFFITFTTTLAINLATISWGTARAFGITQIVFCVLVVIFIFTYRIPLLCAINPVSFLRFCFHRPWVNTGILAVNILLAAGVTGKGMVFIEQFDVSLFDPEND